MCTCILFLMIQFVEGVNESYFSVHMIFKELLVTGESTT